MEARRGETVGLNAQRDSPTEGNAKNSLRDQNRSFW
jgi:hypothetical protein